VILIIFIFCYSYHHVKLCKTWVYSTWYHGKELYVLGYWHRNASRVNGSTETIKEMNSTSSQDKAKATIFIRRHLDECLKCEYLTVRDPRLLWKNLKERFDYQKKVVLPVTHWWIECFALPRLQESQHYNSAMFRIVFQLKFCGVDITNEEMLEKTYSIFHASNITLQQQYRLRGFKKILK